MTNVAGGKWLQSQTIDNPIGLPLGSTLKSSIIDRRSKKSAQAQEFSIDLEYPALMHHFSPELTENVAQRKRF